MPLLETHIPSISLPSVPTPARFTTSFGSARPLSRVGSDHHLQVGPWDHDDDFSGPSIPHPPIEGDTVGGVHKVARWRQNASGWSSVRGDNRSRSTVSTYTSIYPLSSPSLSQSTFFDSDFPPSNTSVAYSDDDIGYDPFEAQPPDWAPWLPNSLPSTPTRQSYMFEDNLGPSLLARHSRPPGSLKGRPILNTANTFYLPPLFANDRPTFATPRRVPTATNRPESRASTTSSSTSSARTRDGCFFGLCGSRGKPLTTPDKAPPPAPRCNPKSMRGKAHYRISFAQDRQWRANILNQAVEQSLAATLFPTPPKPSKSKYDTPSSPSTHRTKGSLDTEARHINRSAEMSVHQEKAVPTMSPAESKSGNTASGPMNDDEEIVPDEKEQSCVPPRGLKLCVCLQPRTEKY